MVLDRVSHVSVFGELGTILTTGFGDSSWSWQVVSNGVIGVMGFGFSWVFFGIGTRQSASDTSSRGLVSRGRGLFRWFSPGRPWKNAFYWKDFHFVSGGVGLIAIRLAFYAGLWGYADLSEGLGMGNGRRSDGVITLFQMLLSLTVSIDFSAVLARSLHVEIRGQTLGTLVMLPRSTTAIVYSKFAGAILGSLTGLILHLLVATFTDCGQRNLFAILTRPGWFCVSTFFILGPHVVAVSALFLRWGAVPVGAAITLGLFFGTLSTIVTGPDVAAGGACGFLNGCACVVCHVVILRRIRLLAAQ
jgi:hypothetical protein